MPSRLFLNSYFVVAVLALPVCVLAKEASEQESYERTIPGTEASFEMVALPGGVFAMGTPDEEEDRNDDEGPQVQVRVQPFWIGKYEVTWAEYKEFMKLCRIFEKFEDKGLRQVTEENEVDAITAPSKLYEPSFTFGSGEDPKQPAVSMSQFAAKQYTKWLSLLTGDFYRLPTEAEWEYACRAGTTTAFSFGEDAEEIADHAWYYTNSEEEYATSKVGQLKPNAWGLFDMHGNVCEWTLDQYDEEHYAKFAEEKIYDAAEVLNWPTELFPRVLRGGSWYHELEAECRSGMRHQSDDDEWRSYDPNSPQSPWWFASEDAQTVGFRIVRPVNPPPRKEWNKYWDADIEQIERDTMRRINEEGRGKLGLVDPDLPKAIEQLESK